MVIANYGAQDARTSGTFGDRESHGRVPSGHCPTRALPSGRREQNIDGSQVASGIVSPSSGQANSNRGPHGESRSSGGARGQLRENILQRKKEPRLPVYYEDPEAARFSIVSETVQALPYRPADVMRSAKRTYQETI